MVGPNLPFGRIVHESGLRELVNQSVIGDSLTHYVHDIVKGKLCIQRAMLGECA